MDWMPQAIREGIFTVLFISGPLVILAAALGLAIGIIQAATQVQEQTIGSAVKIIGIFLALVVFGFYMFQYMSKYTSDSLEKAFKLVPKLGSYVMPRRNFLEVPKDKEPRNPAAENALPEPSSRGSKSGKMAGGLDTGPDVEHTNDGGNNSPIPGPAESQKRVNKDAERLKSQNLQTLPLKKADVTPPISRPVSNKAPSRAQIARPAQEALPEPVKNQAPAQTPTRPQQTNINQARTTQQAVPPTTKAAVAPRPVQQRPATIKPPATPAPEPVKQVAPTPAPTRPASQARPAVIKPVPVKAVSPAPTVEPTPTGPSPAELQREARRKALSDTLNRIKNEAVTTP